MLFSIVTQKRVTTIPYQKDYKRWRKNLSDEHYDAILVELSVKINGTQIQTSSWIPGKNWHDTVFEPIYHACENDYAEAAQFFGLLLWETFLNHPDCWAFDRYELNGVPIDGLTYFKVSEEACAEINRSRKKFKI